MKQHSQQNNTSNKKQLWLKKVRTVILRQAHNNEVSVSNLAEQLEMSKRTFERRMKKLTGKTPKQYLNELRLQMAHQLIVQKKHSNVQKVCHKVGFENRDHFSRIFKKQFGYSPLALIRLMEAKEKENEEK